MHFSKKTEREYSSLTLLGHAVLTTPYLSQDDRCVAYFACFYFTQDSCNTAKLVWMILQYYFITITPLLVKMGLCEVHISDIEDVLRKPRSRRTMREN
jgi:hypothetical protein